MIRIFRRLERVRREAASVPSRHRSALRRSGRHRMLVIVCPCSWYPWWRCPRALSPARDTKTGPFPPQELPQQSALDGRQWRNDHTRCRTSAA